MALIADRGEIEPAMTQVFEDISSPTCEREANPVAPPAELSRQRTGAMIENRIVCRRNPEGTMFRHWVKGCTRDEPIQFRQHDLKLLENPFPLRSRLVTLCSPHQQINIVKCISHALQAMRLTARLAPAATRLAARDTFRSSASTEKTTRRFRSA